LGQLLASLTPPNAGEDQELALALGALCAEPTLLPALSNRATVAAICAVFASGSAAARRHAAWALSSLATHRPIEPSLYSQTLLRMVTASAASPDRLLRSEARCATCWLARSAPMMVRKDSRERRDILNTVVRCAATDTQLQILALAVLGTWAEDLTLHAELIAAEAHEPLILALQLPSEALPPATPREHLYASRAIACLALHAPYRALVVKEGALPLLIPLIESPVRAIRVSAARAVCALTQDVGGALSLLRCGGSGVLIAVANRENRTVTSHGTSAPPTPVKGMRRQGSLQAPLLTRAIPTPAPSLPTSLPSSSAISLVSSSPTAVSLVSSSPMSGSPTRDVGEDHDALAAALADPAKRVDGDRAIPIEVEYARRALAHCKHAWALEEEGFQREDRLLNHLEEELQAEIHLA
jgi:hypothetical protein